MTTEEKGSKQGKSVVKGAVSVITLPVRSVGKSFTLANRSFKDSIRSVGAIKNYGSRSLSNIRSAGEKGANDSFESVFSGPEGEELRDRNLKRFLTRKRVALALMVFFVAYGSVSVIAFQQFYGLLTLVGGLSYGITLCFESQFRLWQLRNRKLSKEEKGSVKNFLSESSLIDIFKPELLGSKGK